MAKLLAALQKSLPVPLILALALLAAAATLGVRRTLTGPEAYGLVLFVLGGGAVSAGLTIASPLVPSSNVVAHVVVALAALAVAGVLASWAVISDGQVFGLILLAGGAGTVAGVAGGGTSSASSSASSATTAIAQAAAALEAAKTAVTGQPPAQG